MSRKLLAVLAILAFVVSAFAGNNAQAANTNTTNTANISVQVAALTLVDAAPERLVFNNSALNPGTVGTGSNLYNQNRNKPGSIQIENIGSTNITHVWLNTTYESSNPFGTGDPNNYDSANYVVVSREDANQYYFVNRVEYNESRSLVYIKTAPGWRYGRIRNTTYEYFWAVANQSSMPACNTTTLRIGKDYHSQTVDGSTDLTNSAQYDEFTLSDAGWTGGGNVGYANINAGSWSGYCAAVWNCGEKLMLYKYNVDAPGGHQCANAAYFWNNQSDGMLYPGNSTVADIQVRIPYGVMMGYSKEGTITIIAMSDQAT